MADKILCFVLRVSDATNNHVDLNPLMNACNGATQVGNLEARCTRTGTGIWGRLVQERRTPPNEGPTVDVMVEHPSTPQPGNVFRESSHFVIRVAEHDPNYARLAQANTWGWVLLQYNHQGPRSASLRRLLESHLPQGQHLSMLSLVSTNRLAEWQQGMKEVRVIEETPPPNHNQRVASPLRLIANRERKLSVVFSGSKRDPIDVIIAEARRLTGLGAKLEATTVDGRRLKWDEVKINLAIDLARDQNGAVIPAQAGVDLNTLLVRELGRFRAMV